MISLYPKKIRRSIYKKQLNKFKLIVSFTRLIKEKKITVNEIDFWIEQYSFTDNERAELNWLKSIV